MSAAREELSAENVTKVTPLIPELLGIIVFIDNDLNGLTWLAQDDNDHRY